ncbi:tyrosine-type recombinase/integrase [Dyella sp.]|uniref:tyrosine-type recombinase/integrase n=1 Tax=Dyella sp. TaxID=1869338 RepID=UPI002B46F25E|nr:integrase arm-type DNA-binding domain-containing protein [Dyella sp.]HKT28779.1 integrase arm-type DNA-binding domain-containing protein [Dyella sp.]
MAELTALAARNAQPREKPYRLAAGRGLYLQVMPNGAKYWRQKYRYLGKAMMIGHGVFPEVSLAQAREACDEARKVLASGVDPSSHRKMAKRALKVQTENSVKAVVTEWYRLHRDEWSETYAERIIHSMENDIFPWLGDRPIGSIEPRDLLVRLQEIQQRGAKETGHRLRRWLSHVFRYAIVKGVAERDPAADLQGALKPIDQNNFPTITEPERIGELLRAIEGYSGTYITRAALKLSPLVFTRPGELRFAEWSEFDLEKGEWLVPGSRLKLRKAQKKVAKPHVVPLSRQAVQILIGLKPLTGAGRYVFPGERTATRPLSENTLNAALHRMGFKGEIVAHGFRHMASTALNEAGWSEDAIERQLAHKDKNFIRATYNKAQYLEERRAMMQAWADYLDKLRVKDVERPTALRKVA